VTTSSIIANTDFCVGNDNFVAMTFSSKKSTKAAEEALMVLFRHEVAATGSSQWLQQSEVSVLVTSSSTTVTTMLLDEHCDSFFVIISGNKNHWLVKFDGLGRELFRREISVRPSYATALGGVVWLFDESKSLFLGWNTRFGNSLQPIEIPPGIIGLPCMVSSGVDEQSVALLMTSIVSDKGPSNVFRKELGSLSRLNKISVLDVIGSNMLAETDVESVTTGGICDNVDKATQQELMVVKDKLHKRNAEEYQHSRSIQKKQRRLLLPTSANASEQFFMKLEAVDSQVLSDDDWEVCKGFLRSGTLSLHRCPSLLRKAAQQQR
jgi:hypothetical protein